MSGSHHAVFVYYAIFLSSKFTLDFLSGYLEYFVIRCFRRLCAPYTARADHVQPCVLNIDLYDSIFLHSNQEEMFSLWNFRTSVDRMSRQSSEPSSPFILAAAMSFLLRGFWQWRERILISKIFYTRERCHLLQLSIGHILISLFVTTVSA